MTNDQIAQIADWLAGTDIALLELTGPDGQWLVTNHAGKTQIALVAGHESVTVKAAHAGVFLTCHPLQTEPLAIPGSPVAQGQILGLLQAGPLLLPVTAPQAGVLVKVLGADHSLVGYGSPLFELRLLRA